MGKLNKAPKKVSKDFQKKKVKVGKRSDAVNVTKVNVASKKIVIRTSSGNTVVHSANNVTSPYELALLIPYLIKQLQHFSPSNRVQGISELKSLLTKDEPWIRQAIMDIHMTQLIPELLEHLLKDEEEVREGVIKLFETLTSSFPSKAILTSIPLIIPFICNGLSNVQKIIRKDNLRVLVILLDKYAPLFTPYQSKLLSHILSIIQDKTLSLPVATTSTTKVSTGITGTAWNRRATGVLERGNNTPKATAASISSNALTVGKHIKQHTSSTTFYHALKALRLLLQLSNQNQESESSNILIERHTKNYQQARTINYYHGTERVDHHDQFKNVAVLLLSLPRVIQSQGNSSSSSGVNSISTIKSKEETLQQQVFERLVSVFEDLVGTEESVQTSHTLALLLEICYSIYHLVSSSSQQSSKDSRWILTISTKLTKLYDFFPFVSFEARLGTHVQKSSKNTAEEVENTEEEQHLVNRVNVKLSEIALLYLKVFNDGETSESHLLGGDEEDEKTDTWRFSNALETMQTKTINYLFEVFSTTLESYEQITNGDTMIESISPSTVQLLLSLSSQLFAQLFSKHSMQSFIRYFEMILRFLVVLYDDRAPTMFKRHHQALLLAVTLNCKEIINVLLSPVFDAERNHARSRWIEQLWRENTHSGDLVRIFTLLFDLIENAHEMILQHMTHRLLLKEKFQLADEDSSNAWKILEMILIEWRASAQKLIIVSGYHRLQDDEDHAIITTRLDELRIKLVTSGLFNLPLYSQMTFDVRKELLGLLVCLFERTSNNEQLSLLKKTLQTILTEDNDEIQADKEFINNLALCQS